MSSKLKEVPIFGKQRVNFTPNFPLTHLCVANNRLVLAMQNNVILKIDLSNPDNPEGKVNNEYKLILRLTKGQALTFRVRRQVRQLNVPCSTEIDLKAQGIEAKLSNMFLDPTGQHLILAFRPLDSHNPANVMHSGPKTSRPKEIQKLRGHTITAVAWNPSIGEGATASCTQPFLLGTSKGLLFEADVSNNEVKVSKQLYDIAKDKDTGAVISGLAYFFIPRTLKCFILVATARKLYQFKGFISNKEDRPWFHPIFNTYLSQSGSEEVLNFGGIESNENFRGGGSENKTISDKAISRLDILYDMGTGYPKSIGYLTEGNSMMFNDVISASGQAPLDNFLKDVKMIRYPHAQNLDPDADPDPSNSPLSLLMTDYHVLFLYKDSITSVCTLNEETIFDDKFEHVRSRVISLTRDDVKGSIWFFTERAIQKYLIKQEDRNIWKIHLDKDDFIKAQEAAKGETEKIEEISTRQADYFFKNKEYEKSAVYYALTKCSFEEIALKFSKIDDPLALKTFLMKKLSTLESTEVTQVTAIVLWLVELYLNGLGSLRDFGKNETAEYRNTEEEFLQFMNQKIVKDCVAKNKKAVYDLMASHGDRENLIMFTLLMRDFDEVIENNIANGQYRAALETLRRQKNRDLYSKFVPILLDKDPSATIDVLIDVGPMLSPVKLLPKFSSKLDKLTAQEITRYLENCINTLRMADQQIHDYLLSLYIHYFPLEKVMTYLELQGNDINRVRYNPTYALHMCLEKKLREATIHLYTIMSLYEEAVALAIEVDLELAKKTANVPEDDEELRKKLWLRIARHVVNEKNDIQQAMEFLQQCDLLKIEDILPFFPNFVTIDHFRDAICAQLQDYNRHIHDLKGEMEEATRAAEVMREEIQQVRSRCSVVKATDQCILCEGPLLIKSFYVFNCGHFFHGNCLLEKVIPFLSTPRKTLLADYQRKLQEISLRHDTVSTDSAGISAREQIISEITDIVAAECIFCGEQIIRLIDVPFIPEDEYDRIQKEWE